MIINDLNYLCSAESDFLTGASGNTNVEAYFDSTSFIFTQPLPNGGFFTTLKTSSKINATLTGEKADSDDVNLTAQTFVNIDLSNLSATIDQISTVGFGRRGGIIVPF